MSDNGRDPLCKETHLREYVAVHESRKMRCGALFLVTICLLKQRDRVAWGGYAMTLDVV